MLATTADGRFAYGPFPDALHATAWAHQLGVMIDPRRTTLTLHAVAAPFDPNGDAPARTAAPVRPATAGDTQAWPDHSHVVLIHDHTDRSSMVGFFADRADADTWSASQRPDLDDSVRLTPLPVLDPPDLR